MWKDIYSLMSNTHAAAQHGRLLALEC